MPSPWVQRMLRNEGPAKDRTGAMAVKSPVHELECPDCRGTFRVMDIVKYRSTGPFAGEPACPHCGGLL